MKKYLGYLKYLSEIIAGAAIVVIVVLLAMQCICRYAFSHTFMFVDDVVICCFAWLTFAGAAAAYRRRMHYGLELVTNFIPARVRPYYDIVIQVVTTLIFAFLCYLLVKLAINSGDKVLYTTGISYKVIYAAGIYSFAMMALHSAWFAVQDVREIGHKTQEVER